jgi:hypothetical protein
MNMPLQLALFCAYLVACGAILVRAVREWVDE